ncbi:MAG: mechanosensitive ion channel family protein [Coriobacteriia bacterium]|nr:mechanosensitive ion channel family protein [Coriobacteriia bacterium]
MDPLFERFILPAALVAAGALAGGLVDALMHSAIERSGSRRGWVGTAAAARAVRGMPTALGALAGAYFAVVSAGLSPRAEALAMRWLFTGAVAAATLAAVRLSSGLVRVYMRREDTPLPSTSIFVNLTRIVVISIGALLALNGLGVSITPLLTALGVGGLAVALALQDTLGNLFAGLTVAASRKICPGDFIRILDTEVEGTVIDITWRYTSLLQPANNVAVVPNARLAAATFVNFSRPEARMAFVVEVPLDPRTDVAAARRIASEVAGAVSAESPSAASDREPVARVGAFTPAGVILNVVLHVSEYAGQFALRDEFLARLHARFAEEGVELAAPFLRP